jgi:hypothetical protein
MVNPEGCGGLQYFGDFSWRADYETVDVARVSERLKPAIDFCKVMSRGVHI